MSPVTHLLIGWLAAESTSAATFGRRERALIALSGIAPDLDGLGIVPELLTRNSDHPLPWFTEWHHILCHNILAAGVCVGLVALLAKRSRGLAAGLAGVAFLLHLVCDVAGSRGPDGNQWPVPVLLPFDGWGWIWAGQWRLDSWQNLLITGAALVAVGVLARRRGRTPVEILSPRADAKVVAALRRERPASGTPSA